MIKIPEEEIRKRMTEWRNYKNILHPKLKERSDRMKEKIKALESENAQLKAENKQIETLQLQLEELRAMKFGKRRNKAPKATLLPPFLNLEKNEEGKGEEGKRTPESYRRTLPSPDQITNHLRLEINSCPECERELVDKKEHVHYREDLQEVERLLEAAKKIVETTIESGRCESCKTRRFAMEVPQQKVILGENIRQMIDPGGQPVPLFRSWF